MRADARVCQRLVTVSRLLVVHHNSASSLALFLRANLWEQQGRKAPPVLLQQVALSAEEEPGPEAGRVGPLFAEVNNSALVLLQQVALPAEEGPGPEEGRVGPLSAEVENPTSGNNKLQCST